MFNYQSLFKEETFLNGELHGLYKTYQWNVEGNWVIDEGFYENGRKTGEWISHGKWNDRFVCNYKNGKKHGSFKGYQQGWVTPKEHSTDIITSEGTYKDGELHGNYKSYHFEKYKSLLYKDLNYKNGKLHGYCKTYRLYPDPGKIEDEGMYKNGEKTGKFM